VKYGGVNTYTFGGLDFLSDKCAAALSSFGISTGDAVAIALPPSAVLAVAQLGVLKTGAVVVPLSPESDTAFLRHALTDSNVRAIVVDESISGTFSPLARNLPGSPVLFASRDLRPTVTSSGEKDFWSELDEASSDFESVEADADSSAFVFYVESTDGINCIVHSQRSIVAQLAAFEMFNDLPSCDDVFRIGRDWALPEVVLGALYPSWWYGCPIAAGDFENGAAPVCETLNQGYGRPETGWILGPCSRWFAAPLGSVGRPVPGRLIEIIDKSGRGLPPGAPGHIAVHKSDPGLCTPSQWNAERTAKCFVGDWFLTGDVGYKNGDGDLFIPPPPSVVGTD